MEVKGKGVPSQALKRECKFQNYLEALYQNKRDQVEFFAFRSVDHVIKHCRISRQGLTADNDKVFMLGPHATRPLGHWRNALPKCLSVGCAPPSATVDAFGYTLQSGPTPGWDLEVLGEQAEAVMKEARLLAEQRLKEVEKAREAAQEAEVRAFRRFHKDEGEDESTAAPQTPHGVESSVDFGEELAEDWTSLE